MLFNHHHDHHVNNHQQQSQTCFGTVVGLEIFVFQHQHYV